MRHSKPLTHALIALVFLCVTALAAQAEEHSDAAALKGLSEGKGVFLVDLTNPPKTALYLEIIEGTHAGMKRQGVEPDFVVVYIGPTVKFLTTQPDDLTAMEFEDELARTQQSIKNLHGLGVRQEVCAIATRVFEVDNGDLPSELSVVGDGFISLIGWQSQGYKLVPIY